MQFSTFRLDEASTKSCSICKPFGNYRHSRLSMGINQSSDVAQKAAMEDLFRHFAAVAIYRDDIGVFNTSWEEQFVSLTMTKVLAVLKRHNFTVNPRKCEWEPDRLGYLLTPTGFKPWKKIQVILALARPQTVMQLRSFIGTVTSYRDTFPRRLHTHTCSANHVSRWPRNRQKDRGLSESL
jgi:hypothetical protein